MKEISNFSNCHRTKNTDRERKGSIPHYVYGEDGKSDRDPSADKYFNDEDDRERRDGPGGD